ncbi:hypothetical protein D3C80_827220 [compost metagenome]
MGKGLKESPGLLGSHADTGIADTNLQLNFVAGAAQVANHDRNLPLFGEFHCVAYQVQDDLAQTQRISKQRLGNVRRPVEQQLNGLVVGLLRNQRGHVV